MGSVNLDSTERINGFLLLKKEAGLKPEKIKIYLNLLKFFADHLSNKGLVIESITNPVDEVMELKFDGLEPETQQEYLQLFLDYISFVKHGAEGMSRRLSIPEKTAKRQSAEKGVSEVNVVKCPKCEKLQKRATKCIDCGMPMGFPKEASKRGVQIEKKRSSKTAWTAVIFILLAFAVYYHARESGGRKYSDGASFAVLMDKEVLRSYSESIMEYLNDLKTVIKSYEKSGKSGIQWSDDVEMILVNMNLLLAKAEKISPPKGIVNGHNEIAGVNRKICAEMNKIKTDMKAGQTVSGSASRSSRTFNTANLMFGELKDLIKRHEHLLSQACKFNNVSC